MRMIVTYDLSAPDQNYDALLKLIKAYPWACLGESSYLIGTDKPSKDLRDEFATALDGDDKLYVGPAPSTAAWWNLPPKVSQWIKNH